MTIKVFLSYKHQDDDRNKWVEKLCQDLRMAGIDAKLDKYEVSLGDSFSAYMTRGIRECDFVLFIVTPEAVKAVESGRGALAFEMQISNARRLAPESSFKIIPIFREGKTTSTYLSDHRYVDFRNDEGYKKNLSELIEGLYGNIQNLKLEVSLLDLELSDIVRMREEIEKLKKQAGLNGSVVEKLLKKNRVKIPHLICKNLYKDNDVYVMQGFDRNIMVLTTQRFEEVYERIIAMNLQDPTARMLRRFFFANAYSSTISEDEILLLPENLRQFADIKDEIQITIEGNILEIWSKEVFDNKPTEKNSRKALLK